MSDRKQVHGFTLVEMAIVLVIIGLLLGGILKGQELIKSARVRNLADQNSAVQAAYYGFLDRYRQVPGDMTALTACTQIGPSVPGCAAGAGGAGGGGVGGGGNGVIGQPAGDELREAAAVWAHLAAAGFITGAYTGTAGDVNTYQTAVPPVAPTNAFNGRLVLTQNASYQSNPAANARLNLALGHNIPASIARELDTKIDDGQPLTGVVHAGANPGGGGTLGALVESGANTCVAGGAGGAAGTPIWDVAVDFPDCNVVILY